MITLMCDACGKRIPGSQHGTVRVTVAHRELTFHLCREDQEKLVGSIADQLKTHRWVEKEARGR